MTENFDFEPLQDEKLEVLYDQGRQYYQAGHWPEALLCFRRIQDTAGNYRQADLIVATIEGNIAQKRQQEVDSRFGQAQVALINEDWATAIARLQAVLDLDPSHQEAATQLGRARRGQELATVYAQGLRHFDAGRQHVALAYFRQMREEAGDYKDVGALIAAIEASMPEEVTTPARPRRKRGTIGWPWLIPAAVAFFLVLCGGGYLAYASFSPLPTTTLGPTAAATNHPAAPSPTWMLADTPAVSGGSLAATSTSTSTPTPTLVPVLAATFAPPSATFTPISTSTFTPELPFTPSPTFTPISTSTFTPEPTRGSTPTFTPEPPLTPGPAFTRVPPPTFTPISTSTFTPQPAFTHVPPPTFTPVSTPTFTPEPTRGSTATYTPEPTLTPTSTFTPSPTSPPTPDPVPSPTVQSSPVPEVPPVTLIPVTRVLPVTPILPAPPSP